MPSPPPIWELVAGVGRPKPAASEPPPSTIAPPTIPLPPPPNPLLPTPPAPRPRLRERKIRHTLHRLKLAAWNVRTLIDTPARKARQAPERRTALVAKELQRLNLDFAALSECRIPEQGVVRDGDYLFYHSGRPAQAEKLHGVAVAVRKRWEHAVSHVQHISPRLMSLRVALKCNKAMHIIAAYAPTFRASEEEKHEFYDDLSLLVKSLPRKELVYLLGDFNARVGNDSSLWQEKMGAYGAEGAANENGLELLQFCAAHGLCIANTMFKHHPHHIHTWKHPRSKRWTTIDYAIVRKKDLPLVLDARVKRSADCWTDHKLVLLRTIVRPVLKRKRTSPKSQQQRLNVSALASVKAKTKFLNSLTSRLKSLPTEEDPTDEWENLKTAVWESAKAGLGLRRPRCRDWFEGNTERIENLLRIKAERYRDMLSGETTANRNAYRQARRSCEISLKKMQNDWWARQAGLLQYHADRHDMKEFYSELRRTVGRRSPLPPAVWSKDGATRLDEPAQIAARWQEHFAELLNNDRNPKEGVFDCIPRTQPSPEAGSRPTEKEICEAIDCLKNGKAPGPDGLPAELLKQGGPGLRQRICALIQTAWVEGKVPQDWRDGVIIPLHKKGDKEQCGNYRGITLLSSVGKVLSTVLLKRIRPILDRFLEESQCGYREGRSTVDLIFVSRQLVEKAREQRRPIYSVFIDLVKAFDTVPRQLLWELLTRLGVHPAVVKLVVLLHTGNNARVVVGNQLTDSFEVRTGVRQGCILAPLLFITFLTACLRSRERPPSGVRIRYSYNNKTLKPLRNRTTTCAATTICSLEYADDMESVNTRAASLDEDLQQTNKAFDECGLKMNTTKTVTMTSAPPDHPTPPPLIVADDTLKAVENFEYLGSILSSDGSMLEEIKKRLAAASRVFFALSRRLWRNRCVRLDTKLAVYRQAVLPVLLYAAETWTTTDAHYRKLEAFNMRCLRFILGVKWFHKVSNATIRARAPHHHIQCLIESMRLRWLGHVCRMEDTRLPKQVLFGELEEGTRRRGGQKWRWKDCIRRDLQAFDIDTERWHPHTQDRNEWRSLLRRGLQLSEGSKKARDSKRAEAVKAARARPEVYPCTVRGCDRKFRSSRGVKKHIEWRHTGHPRDGNEPPQLSRCDIPNCNYEGTARGLSIHKRLAHKSASRVTCPGCGKVSSASGIARHKCQSSSSSASPSS